MAPTGERTDDRRSQRRAARRDANRNQILDAAEVVFGRAGVHNASMRAIADEAGFSAAAIYLFFDNRQHLLAETLARRTDELIALLEATIAACPEPLQALHAIIDETLLLYESRRSFWHLLHQIRTGTAAVNAELGEHTDDVFRRAVAIEDLLSNVVRAGQKQGSIRRGDPRSLTRFYMVLNNERINVHLEGGRVIAAKDFHSFIDDAFGARSGP